MILYYLDKDPKDKLQLRYGYTSTGFYIFVAALIQIVSLIGILICLSLYLYNILEH